jgi:hypothetical protein
VAVGHAGIGQLHGGVELGEAPRGGSVDVEGRLPWEGVRHWAREL